MLTIARSCVNGYPPLFGIESVWTLIGCSVFINHTL